MAASAGFGRCKSVMVCGVKQHTGKTSVSMSLVAGLRDVFGNNQVAFMKPVGHKINAEFKVDDDAVAIREHFGIAHCSFQDMSPVVLDRQYTRRYVNGQVNHEDQILKIRTAYKNLCQANEFVVVEGTGHVGVGSIIGLSNARVARELGLEIVLVANGGLGSTFDELELNRTLCLAHGVRVRGIILNKIKPEKLEMVRSFSEKAFQRWGIPLLGCVPNSDFLDSPSMLDLRLLFDDAPMLSGHQHELRHFERFELVTTSLRRFMEKLSSSDRRHDHTCFVTHASRNDIVMGLISHGHACGDKFKGGLILTGTPPSNVPASCVIDYVKGSNFPVLSVPANTSETMHRLKNFTAKMHATDGDRIERVVKHYTPHIELQALIEGTKARATPPLTTQPRKVTEAMSVAISQTPGMGMPVQSILPPQAAQEVVSASP